MGGGRGCKPPAEREPREEPVAARERRACGGEREEPVAARERRACGGEREKSLSRPAATASGDAWAVQERGPEGSAVVRD